MTSNTDASLFSSSTEAHTHLPKRTYTHTLRPTCHSVVHCCLSKYDFPCGGGAPVSDVHVFTMLNCVMAASFRADVYRASFFGLAAIWRRNLDIVEKLNRDLRQRYQVSNDACRGGCSSVAQQRRRPSSAAGRTRCGCRRGSSYISH